MDAGTTNLGQQIAEVASLNEPVRRALYMHVVRQDHDVSRDEAAEALGISRGLAAFHLDKLVDEGLLEARFQRLTGRAGPGAGRPSKLYRHSGRQIDITLPPRSYELAARLFARSVAQSHPEGVPAELAQAAHELGAAIGSEARRLAGAEAGGEELLSAAEKILTAYGFDPRRDAEGRLRLRNCPFHALVQDYRQMVCGMNLSLLQGVLSGLGVHGIEAVLDPQPGMCCVAFYPRPER